MNAPYRVIEKPRAEEYLSNEPPFIDLLPADGRLLAHMEENFVSTKKLIYSLPKEKLDFRYAAGKWTIKEVLVHIIDMERIYGYRILRWARQDQTELPGFNHLDFILWSGANRRTVENIFDEYEAVRHSTIALLNGLEDEALLRTGMMGKRPVTVRAMAYQTAGHELHHVDIIKERYL